jgi:hypothetical protein
MTSLFRELVSVPTDPCFSINTVEAPSLACSLWAIARPTTPPPTTACVKSAFLFRLVEKDLVQRVLVVEIVRVENMVREGTQLTVKKQDRVLTIPQQQNEIAIGNNDTTFDFDGLAYQRMYLLLFR